MVTLGQRSLQKIKNSDPLIWCNELMAVPNQHGLYTAYSCSTPSLQGSNRSSRKYAESSDLPERPDFRYSARDCSRIVLSLVWRICAISL